MARARMIKPDFSDDEKMAEVSFMARLVYILLWPQSDDYGVVKGNPRWLKTRLFPYDETLTLAQFCEWLKELEKLGRLRKFMHNDEPFYFMPKFLVHQRIEKPSKTRNPEPPKSVLDGVGDESVNSMLPVGEDSPNSRQPVGDEVEVEEEIEKEPEGEVPSSNGSTTGQRSESPELNPSREALDLSLARNGENEQAGDGTSPLRERKLTGDDVVEQPLRVEEIEKYLATRWPNRTIRERQTLAGRIEKLARDGGHDLLPQEAGVFAKELLANAADIWAAQKFVTVLQRPEEQVQVYDAVKRARNGNGVGVGHQNGNGRGP